MISMLPLTTMEIGVPGTIKKICGNEEIHRFLKSLGFVAGSQLTVIADISGNLIVNVKESRVALNREMARKIYV